MTRAAMAAGAVLGLAAVFAAPARADNYIISGTFDNSLGGPLDGGSFYGTYSITGLPFAAGTGQHALTSWDVFLMESSGPTFELTNGGGAVGYINDVSAASGTTLDIFDATFVSSGFTSGNFLQLQFLDGFDGSAPAVPFALTTPDEFGSFGGSGGNIDGHVSDVAAGSSAAVPEPSSVVLLGLMLGGLALGAKRFATSRS